MDDRGLKIKRICWMLWMIGSLSQEELDAILDDRKNWKMLAC